MVGFYGTELDTYFVDGEGAVWHVGSYCGERSVEAYPRRVEVLPSNARRLHNSVVEEEHWQRIEEPREASKEGEMCVSAYEISRSSAAEFWDSVVDEGVWEP